ncbi:MAG: c-type cytochrome biogenesis protein CcmI [Betaproteobacteria bacterium]|nr:c-type cytochrome biogenesis protein CcmI [Betaproteobacteria bacterium]
MTLFGIIAAVLIAAALGFVLPPLLKARCRESVAVQPLNVAVYRDQLQELEADRRAGTIADEQYERARLELEQRLLDDLVTHAPATRAARASGRAPAIAVGLAVPLLAVAIYYVVGTPHALAPAPVPADVSKGLTVAQVQVMVSKLAERMKQNPDDPQGWVMLGKAYGAMGRFDDAVAAYAKAVQRVPDNPHLLADYADALAMAHGQSFEGEPEALVMRALKIDPDHPKSLALAGTIAFEKKDYPNAVKHWERLLAGLPADAEVARGVQAGITEARERAGKGGAAQPAAAAAAGVSGKVSLAPALAAKAAPGDTVFVFARTAQGSRMPLAILRKKVSDLPLSFTLDDSLAMSPATRLSSVPQVIVGARISKSGDATVQPGDLQGVSKVVNNTQQGVEVVIDTEVQ